MARLEQLTSLIQAGMDRLIELSALHFYIRKSVGEFWINVDSTSNVNISKSLSSLIISRGDGGYFEYENQGTGSLTIDRITFTMSPGRIDDVIIENHPVNIELAPGQKLRLTQIKINIV